MSVLMKRICSYNQCLINFWIII